MEKIVYCISRIVWAADTRGLLEITGAAEPGDGWTWSDDQSQAGDVDGSLAADAGDGCELWADGQLLREQIIYFDPSQMSRDNSYIPTYPLWEEMQHNVSYLTWETRSRTPGSLVKLYPASVCAGSGTIFFLTGIVPGIDIKIWS